MSKKKLKQRLTELAVEGNDIYYAFLWERFPEESEKNGTRKPKKESPSVAQRYHVWFTSTTALLKFSRQNAIQTSLITTTAKKTEKKFFQPHTKLRTGC